jgi:inward rectifier potassium channel
MEAQAQVFCLKRDFFPDGTSFARISPLELQRDITPAFSILPWTIIHVINESSPLYGMSIKQVVDRLQMMSYY